MFSIQIKYSKICRRHEQVVKAKRMLLRAYKTVEDYDTYCKIELTGFSEIDYNSVKCWFNKEIRNYSKMIATDIKNDEEYNEGFYFSKYEKFLSLCRQLYDIMQFIDNKYPVIETKTAEYEFVSTDADEMWREAEKFCSQLPKDMLQREYIAVDADNSQRKLYPYTFDKTDLKGSKKLIIRYL